MTGGLLQLVSTGQQDEYLSINPDISFFKYAYKKHTNFSMESLQLTFDLNPILNTNILSSGYQCKIPRYGDLLKEMYLCFRLPDVYSSDVYKFRWIENIGSIYIKKATISVGGVIIDTITGEWLNIKNELTGLSDKKNYNNLVGNVEELIAPKINEPRIGIRNNRFYYTFYPSANLDSTTPSISGRELYIPLSFWFTKTAALALPLLKLQYAEIYLTIEPEISENLYQVYSTELEKYVSPLYYNELYNDNISINTFVKDTNLFPYIEANYIFIDNDERNIMLATPKSEYLVEQVDFASEERISANTNSSLLINLNIHKPTKEIIWTMKRDDYYRYNDRSNYTASVPESRLFPILNKATIYWNKNTNRIEEKNGDYFNMIQPYQYHEAIPRQGIYTYSFALFPEKETPTGYYNAAVVSTTLALFPNSTYNNDSINQVLTRMGKNTYDFEYIVNVYTIQYNVYSIIGGQAAMIFS